MRLQAVPFDVNPHTAADWMEMRALVSPHHKVNFSDVERAWEANRVAEDQDPGGECQDFDSWLADVVAVLDRRLTLGGNSYPFEFRDNDAAFVFLGQDQISDGRAVYLLSLILSVASESAIFDRPVPITPWMRDAFQACSGWAAAGSIHGSSYVIGWPRPDGTSFLEALRLVFLQLMDDGEIVPREEAPPGSLGREKDGGIDVIAWKQRIDRAGGKSHLFGQVASGANWRDKPIAPYIEALRVNWLTQSWVIPPAPAMFIPYSLVPVDGATYEEQIRYWAGMYGQLFYREVLPAYAEKGLALARAGQGVCHRADELPRLIQKERDFIDVLVRAQARP